MTSVLLVYPFFKPRRDRSDLVRGWRGPVLGIHFPRPLGNLATRSGSKNSHDFGFTGLPVFQTPPRPVRSGSRLAWAGFGYSFPPTTRKFSYTVRIEKLP